MINMEKWESQNKCLNIFFPLNVEISNKQLYYLYGISNENTFVVIHVSYKYIDKFKIKKNDKNKDDWKYFRIIGEINLVKNLEELQNSKITKCVDNSINNYLLLSYYKNKPIFIKKLRNEENKNALFMLYNTNKYIYNLSLDHVNNLVSEAFSRGEIFIKENKNLEAQRKNKKNLNLYKEEKKNCEEYIYDKINEINRLNVDNEIINENYDNDNIKKNKEVNEKDNKKKKCKNIQDKKISNYCKDFNKEEKCSDKLDSGCNLECNLKSEEELISFNFVEDKIMKSLDLKQIISFINKKCIYANSIENYNSANNSNRRDFFLKKEKKYIISFVFYILIFFIYFISLINRSLYYIIYKPNFFNKFISPKRKINTFHLLKEKLLFHSEWYYIIDNLIRNKKNPSEYHKYKQILLIRFFNLITDMLLGVTIYFLLTFNIINFYFFCDKLKIFYDSRTLTSILGTLLQNPLGLKLNNNFTSFIGSVIVSILDKWDYLRITISIKKRYIVEFFRYSSLLGLSFFLSLLIDYLRFITAHVSLIFFFLKKMCTSFNSNIYSLYLLFNGKKWNILKLRVDTNYYTNEEVIFGTILFTMLIFLYPTTFVLVVVFGIIYFIINRIIYSLFLLKEIILYSPFYIFFVTSNFNKYISTGIKFTKFENLEYEELKNFPKSYYLLLENNKFLFCDKIKLLINIFFNSDKYK
ncbi:phosphatidylinositol N-acetylglucosaminyltransferase subunit GPI1, putative [Plasmodium relictum]|uniref:Phosphatidylinositol N-acetylglucosaminyltransferase subunit GPI1, putative n=1 Tax=Plasmodium relictum TaxID=85471 RepID=A0A1J1H7Q4_PLARL|nr:phosphatidylinositol N-acetylglucosaminyltransferase subunit GPI1, putative [Plasmodium relictum]CRH00947.1 phosphatidylinositol N-acetylglucosaminyltransferase subunit GPI1, putative [Plasmodium relictum]